MLNEKIQIRCPLCEWKPDGKAYWVCTCGHFWNTFDTAGFCPSCNKKWETTQCPGCVIWSKHEDWYIIPIDFDDLVNHKASPEPVKHNSKSLFQKLVLGFDPVHDMKQKAKSWLKNRRSFFAYYPCAEYRWIEVSLNEPENLDFIETGMQQIAKGHGFNAVHPLEEITADGFNCLMRVLSYREIKRVTDFQFYNMGYTVDAIILQDNNKFNIKMYSKSHYGKQNY